MNDVSTRLMFDPSMRAPKSAASTSASNPKPMVTEPFWISPIGRQARAIIKARNHRRSFFNSALFSDPAWDILLDLLSAEAEGKRRSISGVGLTANIPATTALRWISALEQEGLVRRENDPLDRRRTFVMLTDGGLLALRRYFETCAG